MRRLLPLALLCALLALPGPVVAQDEDVEVEGTKPASTTYVAAAASLDEERSRSAEAQVEQWRHETTLPFPEFSPEQREKIADTLDFPPAGSPPAPPPPDEPTE